MYPGEKRYGTDLAANDDRVPCLAEVLVLSNEGALFGASWQGKNVEKPHGYCGDMVIWRIA